MAKEVSTDDQIYDAFNEGGTVATIAEDFGVSVEHVWEVVDAKNSERAVSDDNQKAKAEEVSKKEQDKLKDKVEAPAGTPAEDESSNE